MSSSIFCKKNIGKSISISEGESKDIFYIKNINDNNILLHKAMGKRNIFIPIKQSEKQSFENHYQPKIIE